MSVLLKVSCHLAAKVWFYQLPRGVRPVLPCLPLGRGWGALWHARALFFKPFLEELFFSLLFSFFVLKTSKKGVKMEVELGPKPGFL